MRCFFFHERVFTNARRKVWRRTRSNIKSLKANEYRAQREREMEKLFGFFSFIPKEFQSRNIVIHRSRNEIREKKKRAGFSRNSWGNKDSTYGRGNGQHNFCSRGRGKSRRNFQNVRGGVLPPRGLFYAFPRSRYFSIFYYLKAKIFSRAWLLRPFFFLFENFEWLRVEIRIAILPSTTFYLLSSDTSFFFSFSFLLCVGLFGGERERGKKRRRNEINEEKYQSLSFLQNASYTTSFIKVEILRRCG